MGNGSTWPENDYRGMNEHAHTRAHTHQLSQMKQLTSTHAHTMNWKYYLQTSLLIQPQKRQHRDDTVFMFFLPKIKCLITSKQMASTHPNLSKISCRMENTPIYVSAYHTQRMKNVCQILNLLYRPTLHLLWYREYLRAVSWLKYFITIRLNS